MMHTLYQYNTYEQPKFHDDDMFFVSFWNGMPHGRCKVSLSNEPQDLKQNSPQTPPFFFREEIYSLNYRKLFLATL